MQDTRGLRAFEAILLRWYRNETVERGRLVATRCIPENRAGKRETAALQLERTIVRKIERVMGCSDLVDLLEKEIPGQSEYF